MLAASMPCERYPSEGVRPNSMSDNWRLFVGGREVARQPGAMGAADIVRWTRSHLG